MTCRLLAAGKNAIYLKTYLNIRQGEPKIHNDWFDFQMYFNNSKTLHICLRTSNTELRCKAVTDLDPNDYFGYNVKVDYPEIYFSTSLAPNGKDIWLSGGRGVTYGTKGRRYVHSSVYIENRVTVMR